MFQCGCAGYIAPHGPKPAGVVVFRNTRQLSLLFRGLPVAAVFAEHQNVLNVVLDDGVWLEWLSQERGTVLDLIAGVGDLVPKNWCQVVEPDSPATYRNVRVQRHDHVPAIVVSPSDAHVADHAHQAPAFRENSVTVTPRLVQFVHERLVVGNVSEL